MIGQTITDKDGVPINSQGQKLSPSAYKPSKEVQDLFTKVQKDYQTAYMLMNRPFREFDGYSPLDRARLDQETFGAYVGVEFVPQHKKWRYKGRKNTSRNKLISILARMLAGMLYPMIHSKNEEDEEDKMSARVMRILVEDWLRKARYEVNFLFMVLSALVNPAAYVNVEFLEVMQTIKKKAADGTYSPIQVLDELMSGLALNVVPFDELWLNDVYSGTGRIQNVPCVLRVRRISYDVARSIHSGKHYQDGKDLFDFVQAGKTRVVAGAGDNQMLYDVDWTEADGNFVQEITALYRSEDLEVTWVGGVFMGSEKDPYNSNPFKHRRMVCHDGEWNSVPVVNYAASGYEPLDPSGRFFFYKSAAFKEYWDDQKLNTMDRIMVDGTYLDVIKPIFMSGVTKVDGMVIAPGATIGMPSGSTATPYSIGPNLAAAYKAMATAAEDIGDSTKAEPVPSSPVPGVSATQIAATVQQAKLALGNFSLMIADLIEQVGALTVDLIVMHGTVGELDASVPGALSMKYKTHLVKGKDKGKNVTNKIVFTDKQMGRKFKSEQAKEDYEWEMFNKSGKDNEARLSSDQRLFEVNPFKFARTIHTCYADADQIISKSLGTKRQEAALAFSMMSNPLVAPFTDPQAVADDFVIEEYGGDDPDRYKRKGPPPPMMPPGSPPGQGGLVEPPQSNPSIPKVMQPQ